MDDRRAAPPRWAGFPVLVLVAALQAAVLVPWRYLASEDGPTNIASPYIITHYGGAYRHYFTLDFFPKFDMLWQVVLSGVSLVVPIFIAERLLVVLLVIALPIAGWYAAEGVRRGAGPVAYLLLPVSIGYFFHAGYYSFCLGAVLFFVTVGWWLRHRDGEPVPTVVLAAFIVLTYLAHVVAAAMAVGVIAVVAAWFLFTEDRKRGARQLVALALATAPMVLLAVVYLATHQSGGGTSHWPIWKLVAGLISLWAVIVSMNTLETALSVLLVALLAVVCISCLLRAPRRFKAREHAWFAASVAALFVYLIAPDTLGDGGQITPRLLQFFLFTVLMWIAVFPLPRRLLAVMVGGAVAISLGLTILHLPKYVGFNRDLREYAEAGAHMTKGSTVLPINLVVPGDHVPGLESSRRIRPIIQASGYLVANEGVVDLSHFQAQFSYFITQFRDELNPFDLVSNGVNWLDDTTPDLDLLDYPKRTKGEGSIDYVIVWGANVAGEDVLKSPEVQSIDEQLATAYDLVFTSSRGHLQLYKLRGSG